MAVRNHVRYDAQMRSGAALILALATCATAQQTTPISGFECQVAGALMSSGVPDCEGWQSFGGAQIVMPDGIAQVGPCALPLDGSAQWCEVSPNAIGPASPIVSPSGPPAWPYTQGTVSEMRLIGTIRRECTDHIMALGENHLRSVLLEYVEYYNNQRPHGSLGDNSPVPRCIECGDGDIISTPVLQGLHHSYRRSA